MPAWPWPGRHHRFLASGRHAAAWLLAATLPRGARVLCPASICASVPGAVAAAGTEVVYYGQDEVLHPRWAELASAEADALLLVHPLGRLLPAAPVRALRRRRPDLVIIEDFSQTLLNREPLIGFDLAFASLRKLLPVPDGGVVIDYRGRGLPAAPRPTLKASPFVRKRLAGDPTAEDDLDAWCGPPAGIWQGTLDALARLDPAVLRRARRRCYRHLAGLAGWPGVRPFWPRLPDGLAPLALPLRCRNRHDTRRRLERAGIAAEPYWPVPEAARAAAGTAGRVLAGTLLLVPCTPDGHHAAAATRGPSRARTDRGEIT